jgi:DNA polymerase-1
MSTFLIIDGNSMACRACYAVSDYQKELKNSLGKITGGTYRFLNIFTKLLKEFKPTHIVVVWDSHTKTFRKEIYSDYKGNRNNVDDINDENTAIMFQDIKEILNLIGVLNVEYLGYEGDDLCGTFANISTADKNLIVSGDRDIFQLIDSYTNVVYLKTGDKKFNVINEEILKEKYDLDNVRQFIYLKAMTGDVSDNIQGIEGCGEKTASKLLRKYGNLQNILNAKNIECKGVSKTVIENIKKWKDKASTILKLVTIYKKVPIELEFEDCELNINWYNAISKFNELEFNSYINNIDKLYSGGE